MKDDADNEYPDFIQHHVNFAQPISLIAKHLKPVISMYQKNIEMKAVAFVEKELEKQTIYYVMDIPEIDCASSESKLDHMGKIKELVLDKEKVGNQRIFYVSRYHGRAIVRLDVAESILRRNSYGIAFEKLKVEQGGL